MRANERDRKSETGEAVEEILLRGTRMKDENEGGREKEIRKGTMENERRTDILIERGK